MTEVMGWSNVPGIKSGKFEKVYLLDALMWKWMGEERDFQYKKGGGLSFYTYWCV